jgi:hypothetical protein
MKPEIIETDKFILRIHDENNLLEYIVKENATIDVHEVLEGKQLLGKARPNKKFYVLAQGIGFFTCTRDARIITSSKEYSDNTYAIAFYTKNPSILILSKMYMKINKPHVPTRVFNDLEAARKWLTEKMVVKSH